MIIRSIRGNDSNESNESNDSHDSHDQFYDPLKSIYDFPNVFKFAIRILNYQILDFDNSVIHNWLWKEWSVLLQYFMI